MDEILVIDDESEVSMIFSKLLADHGYAIHHCATAEQALAQIGTLSPKVVFLDIRLPGMDGVTALPRLLERKPDLKIVMMTAYQTVESVISAMKSGAVDYLVKPLNPEMVLQAVNKYAHVDDSRFPSASARKGGASRKESERAPQTFVAQSSTMKSVLDVAEKFAASDGTVLILGESGTGKEMLANFIHQKSPRARHPFHVVDCASIPETLFESELFGYEKGALTGADAAKAGRFELANNGTLFLDEIGNVPLTMQAKLLRFIEDHTVSRLGGKKSSVLDIRLITATNVDLKKLVEEGTFREDLYYRLSALLITLPPLRNRPKEERESIAQYFLERNAALLGRARPSLSEATRQLIHEYPWPGNVREMQNAFYSAALLCDAGTLEPAHFPVGIQSYSAHRGSFLPEKEDKTLRQILEKVEKDQILSVMKQTGGNKKRASEILDMDYKNLLSKLKKYSQESGGPQTP